jgi:uncharacterized protein (TIGR02001 family)
VKFADTGYKGDLEHDIYLGITNKIGENWVYDVGVIDYTYNQHIYDYQEIYASMAYGSWIKGKIFYSPNFGGDAPEVLFGSPTKSVSAWYVSGDSTIPLPANFSVLLHAGYSFGDYWHASELDTKTADWAYTDYSAGLGYTAGKFSLALKYVDTNTSKSKGNRFNKDITGTDVFSNDGRIVFTVATTFPW